MITALQQYSARKLQVIYHLKLGTGQIQKVVHQRLTICSFIELLLIFQICSKCQSLAEMALICCQESMPGQIESRGYLHKCNADIVVLRCLLGEDTLMCVSA